MATKKSVKINKKPIKKKAKAKKPKVKEVSKQKVEAKDDSFEIPVSKLLMVVGVIAVIALLVFAGIKIAERPAKSDGPEGVAAIVNGEEILWETIDKQYDSLSAAYQGMLTHEILINQSIDETLLIEQVELKEVVLEEGELESLVARVESQFTEEELEMTLSSQGLTMEDFTKKLENRLLVNELLEQEIPEMKITDEEIQEYYEENKALLDTPEMVRASHILVETREEAEEVLAKLDQGEEFADLAKEYSLDGSAQAGGDLGYFPREVMVSEFEDAAFSTEVGEVSDVVETLYGFHIIYVTDKKEAAESTMEDLKSTIKFNLFDLKLRSNQDKFQEYMSVLRAEADIQVFLR